MHSLNIISGICVDKNIWNIKQAANYSPRQVVIFEVSLHCLDTPSGLHMLRLGGELLIARIKPMTQHTGTVSYRVS